MVTQSVVDLLEVVEVHDHDRHPFALATGMVEPVAQPVVEQHPIGKPGQSVVQSLVSDAGLDPGPVGDIGESHGHRTVRQREGVNGIDRRVGFLGQWHLAVEPDAHPDGLD